MSGWVSELVSSLVVCLRTGFSSFEVSTLNELGDAL